MGKARGEHYLILYMMLWTDLCEQGEVKQRWTRRVAAMQITGGKENYTGE